MAWCGEATSHYLIQCLPRSVPYGPLVYKELTHWGRDKMATIFQTTFEIHFLEWKCIILIKISLKFVPKGQINDIPLLVQIMASHQPGDKPLPEPMMVSLLAYICITRPQWLNACIFFLFKQVVFTVDIWKHGSYQSCDLKNYKHKWRKKNGLQLLFVWVIWLICVSFAHFLWTNGNPDTGVKFNIVRYR